jgi:Domain of unknown function (DUF4406)
LKVYLAGPMRGIAEFNFPAFHAAAAKLRALGYEVFSPAENDEQDGLDTTRMRGSNTELADSGFDLNAALAADLAYICTQASTVVLLPGWETSQGVKAEVATAEALNKPVMLLEAVLAPTLSGRTFSSGAYRDTEDGKYDYEGFLSPGVLVRFAEYMHKHRRQSDGRMRDSGNWQKGIPLDVYMKSMFRHFMDVWQNHRAPEPPTTHDQIDSLMALMFNVQGYAHELLKRENENNGLLFPHSAAWPIRL